MESGRTAALGAKFKNILVIRPDRIGDVILSTPVFQALSERLPRARVTALVAWEVAPLIEGLPGVSEVLPLDRRRGFMGWVSLFQERRFDAVVFLHPHPKLALAARLAGIPVRVGPLSKPYSFVLFNAGIRQRRSQVEKHEAQYNLDLLSALGLPVGEFSPEKFPTRIVVKEEARDWARDWLEKRGLDASAMGKLVAVHPGMGGSAQNWPMASYRELVHRLIGSGYIVLGTFGPAEHALADELGLGKNFAYLAGPNDPIQNLVGLLCFAKVVVAPSTGPLHIAVALGKRVVGLYPENPIQESPRRWGPYGVAGERAAVLTPGARGGDMSTLGVPAVLDQVMAQMKYENENPSPR
ncbi:MAG: glycosyltransferase family 9 protein [Bacteriovoracia bacterium]